MRKILIIGAMLITFGIAILLFIFIALHPPKLDVPEKTDQTLSNLSIWNPGFPAVENQTLQISSGLITDIRPSQDTDLSSICDGCFAMPGLIDAHIHTPPSIAIGNRELFSLLYLQHGVTTVRDLGQLDDGLPELVEKLNTGKLVGPRMYHCGPIIDGEPPSFPGAISVTSEHEGRRLVAEHNSRGVDCIKVYGNLSPDAFKGVSEEAEKLGLPFVGHTPSAISLLDIKNFESQHYTGIPYLTKAAPKDRAYKPQDLIDMTPSDVEAVLKVMSENNISFLPTNANNLSRLTVSDSERFPPSAGFRHLPTFWEIAWPSIVSYPETKKEIDADLEAIPAGLSFIRKAHQANVDVLVGTDVIMPYVIPGESLFQQLELMSQALGSDELALQAATQINGRHIDKGKIGEILIGANADILLYKQDPRGDLSNVQNWDYAIVGGRIYTREDLDANVERYGKHFRSSLYTTIMTTAYGFIGGEYEDSEVAKH